MLIRFGVYKYEKVNGKKKTISKNDEVEVPVTLEQYDDDWQDSHALIRETIRAKYPGWMIHGYCPDPSEIPEEAKS